MRRRAPRLDKIRRAIGYSPRHNLDSIVDSVIEYERSARTA